MRTVPLFTTLSLCAALACASTQKSGTPAGDEVAARTEAKLRAALAGAHRSPENAARDTYRHPLETLTFFGLRDDMTVLELWPGGGWYTEVLAPVLKEHGKLYVTANDPNGDPEKYGTKRAREMLALKEKHPEVLGAVELAILPDALDASLDFGVENVDLVLTFRSLHGWIGGKHADHVLKAAYKALKPGGILGVVDHRAPEGGEAKGGYVPEAMAIALAEAAGFTLVEKSEINANPRDTKDHPDGVWNLPPSLRGGDKDRDRYLAIGESDRFTLKFRK